MRLRLDPLAPSGLSLTNETTFISGGGSIPATLPPSGVAGGDLSGIYPNPTVSKINGIAYNNDPLTQYALLAGRSGGQTLIGGTASGNNLTLQSTSNATKGKLLFGSSAYDEVNDRLGIGNATPLASLHVKGTQIIFEDNDTSAIGPFLYVTAPGQSGTGTNASEFGFFIAGPGSTNTTQGPNFLMRGNTFSRIANQRGKVAFLGGSGMSSPTDGEGDIGFLTNAVNTLIAKYSGKVEVSQGGNKDQLYFTSTTANTGITWGADTNLYRNAANTLATDDSFIAGASFSTAYRAITALRTLDATDNVIDCTANTFTVTLPTAVSITGRQYTIKNSGSGVITVATTSAQTIDDGSTASLAVQYVSITVVSDGANWKVI